MNEEEEKQIFRAIEWGRDYQREIDNNKLKYILIFSMGFILALAVIAFGSII